ncbi:hypothetical protein O7627_27695 [Solwaraspora sp. WMMD1047]|uniref:hypothetical protein n=1 Tax=Solwaraspora sp. WMMD1047 TaxID=3016102 RepID=UPI0024168114|nr:hypothetical protein [Solwaraspora sp. WMMD1047]MDG4833061.1 hypothetical protein [Solwaraspora sp. WMMD1047]
MRHFSALLGIPVILMLAACAQGGGQATDGSTAAPDPHREAFEQRANQVAAAWQEKTDQGAWQTGFVPLQDLTVVGDDAQFTDATKQAFAAGWYRDQVRPPTKQPTDGTITFADGNLDVPLVSAAQAYQEIDHGDPPPCPGRPAAPPPAPTGGPDDPTSSGTSDACIPLTVTAIELGSTTLRTSRGEATVPAWLFTIEELGAQVARVAVEPSAVTAVPEPSPPAETAEPELVAAQDLTAVDGAELTYRLGVGACDENITPLVQERDDVVLVGGAVTRSSEVCTDQLLIEPVTVTLDEPLGERPVLDALTGQVLILTNG